MRCRVPYFAPMMKLDDDPEPLDGKYLGIISEDFVQVSDIVKEACYQVRARKISDYPIVVACRVVQPIGGLFIPSGQYDLVFNYSLSYVGEFVDRELMDDEGLTAFQQAYKDPDEYCCLFVVEETFTNFVFIPYPDDSQEIEN